MNSLKDFSLVEVFGLGCASCDRLMYDCAEIAKNMNIPFMKYDISEHQELIEKWGIERVPALLICKGGEPFAKCYGWQPREILELYIEDKIDNYQKENANDL